MAIYPVLNFRLSGLVLSCGLWMSGKADTFLLAGWSAMHGAATLLIDRVLGRTSGLSQRAPKRIAGDLMATLFEGILRNPGE